MDEFPRTQIILEVASNHNGDLDTARELIAAAAEVGADYVKFQSYQSRTLVGAYERESQRRAALELSDEDHVVLVEECRRRRVRFLTTPFDVDRIAFLSTLGLDAIKVASPDIGSATMIRRLREHFPHLIVSTGMSTTDEVQTAANLLQGHRFTFLHCVSLYPTPVEKAHLIRMDWLRQFTPSVGLSCHSLDLRVAKVAIARGAAFVEKHFTLSRRQEDFGHSFAIEPREARALCDWRDACATIMGDSYQDCLEEERPLRTQFIGKWGANR